MARHVIEIRETTSGRTSRTQAGSNYTKSNKTDKKVIDGILTDLSNSKSIMAKVGGAVVAEVSLKKVNDFVGSYTTNTIATKNRNIGLSYAGAVFVASQNPVGWIALGAYTGLRVGQYMVTLHNMNVSSSYLLDLSGGTFNQSKGKGMGL